MLSYAVTTTDATNKVTATTDDPSAVISIKHGDVAVVNGTSVTWDSGANIITIVVTDGEDTTTYVVTVTK